MKKFLSLVLALVMTMSLVTVSAGAKDFTDASKITYDEAVAVMSAAKVIDGYAEGDFRPTNTLTRGAAAKIICNLILGPTTASALVADAAPYKDVPTTNTFAGYIAYCAKEGIISGYADGTFKPANTLTGYAFMKMLLGALGYDAATEGYTGNNWSIQVAKRALNIGLDDDLTGSFNGVKAVNREEACLYAFNTLKATMVEYENNNSVTVNGITFTNKSTAKDMVNNAKVETIKDDNKMQFAEKYFDKLSISTKAADKIDDFGRPAITWSYDVDDVGTYADSPKYTVVLSKDYEDDTDVQDELRDLTKNNKLKVDGDTDLFLNGEPMTTAKAVAELGKVDSKVKTTGMTLELFCTKNHVDTVVAYFYKGAKIADVDDNVTKADARDDVTCYVELKDVDTFNDNDIVGFDAKTYVKDAHVAYIAKGDEIIDSYIADEVEGSLTTIKGNDYATMSGTKYSVVKASGADVSDFKTGSDNTYKLFLDKNGYVIGTKTVDEDANLDEIYYVALTWSETSNKYGNAAKTQYYAQLVDLTG